MPLTLALRVLCISLLLASCADLPKQGAPDLNWQERTAQLTSLNRWQARGKLAIRTAQQSESVSLIWDQSRDNTHLVLSGPLGVGTTTIDSDQKKLRVSRDGQSQTYDISSPRASTAAIGWDLPLQALPHWLKGLPTPGDEIQGKIVKQGLLRQLEQLGWTVTYEDYGQFEQYTLPTRLKIERDSTRVRLIIRSWKNFSS